MLLEMWSLKTWNSSITELVPVVSACLVRLSCSLTTLVTGIEDWIWVLIASVPAWSLYTFYF